MDFDKILEISSAQHVSDRFLEHKIKTRNIKSYLSGAVNESWGTENVEKDLEQSFFTDTKPGVATKFSHLPFEGNNAEGLKVCLSVVVGANFPDWQRKKQFVEGIWGRASEGQKKELRTSGMKVAELIRKHEDKQNLNASEKDEILNWAENFSDFIIDIAQMNLDADSEGSSGGKANTARINNLIPISISFRGKNYKGLIAVSDPNKNSGMIIWITDTARLGPGGKISIENEDDVNGSLARSLWNDAVEVAKITGPLKKGSVRLIPGTLEVSKEDAAALDRIGVIYDDSPDAKLAVKTAYISTVNSLFASGGLGKVGDNKDRQGDENIAKYLVGWKQVMDSHLFWSMVNV